MRLCWLERVWEKNLQDWYPNYHLWTKTKFHPSVLTAEPLTSVRGPSTQDYTVCRLFFWGYLSDTIRRNSHYEPYTRVNSDGKLNTRRDPLMWPSPVDRQAGTKESPKQDNYKKGTTTIRHKKVSLFEVCTHVVEKTLGT